MSIGRIGARDDGVTALETFRYNASGGETSLSGADAIGRNLIYRINYEIVYLNGVRLVRESDYTATTGNSIDGLVALAAGDVVEVMVFQALDLADALSKFQADSYYVVKSVVNAINGVAGLDGSAKIAIAQLPNIATNAQAGSYTLVLTDAGKLVEMGSGSAQTLTVPPNASVAFPVGTKIDVIQTGAGETTIAAGSGVTINSEGDKVLINAQWQAVSLVKRATDTWVLIGALA